MDDTLRQAPIGVIETTADGRVEALNETVAETLETTREAMRGTDIRERFPRAASPKLPAAFEDGTPTARSFEEYYPRIDRWLAVDVTVGEDDRVLVYVRDRTPAQETERRVDRLEQRLERVQGIGSLVSAVVEQVIGASSRVDVGRTVCEHLGGTDLYRFAWVGERDFPADRLRVLASAGGPSDLRGDIEGALGGDAVTGTEPGGAGSAAADAGTTLPGQAAVAAGTTRHIRAIAEDATIPRPVRRAAFGEGLQSCLAVPLAHQGTVYGVVSVYSGREDGFDEHERAALETLGSVAGFAIRAIRQEDLLVADTVTEVTLEVDDETVPFVRVTREVDCHLTLEGAVPRDEAAVVCYLGTDGATDEVKATLAACEGVSDVRWIRSGDDPLLQATVEGGTPVATLVAWGATVETADYTPGSARIVAEAPPDADVRRLVEAVDDTVADTTLLSKAERTRDAESVEAFRDDLDERLTDRQRTVLRTAHLSEYFTSPRESSSAEVAESLDIAGSTMLYHLRRAQRKLVDAYFERDHGRSPADDG
ncbi:bacterio-opsin activator domain-containing protein [Halorubellus salinus]|uniref:bacterio-opsin activator domain-containing protein n=1 Tax=Halorubellus salinus TaxID=755309 RepID=UPI001D083A9C|nr:bacterio-opsin activator domain-containing protein [Halorubellus salinus]